jgi:hypothetical protein
MIPIDFLIDKLDIKIKVSKTDNHTIISIRSMKKNLMCDNQICNKHLEMEKMSGLFYHKKNPISIISHHISQGLENMFPDFKNWDIDYSGLEKYLKKDFVESK